MSHPSGVIAGSSTLSACPSATEDCSLKTEEKTERQCGQYATVLRDRCRTVRQFRSDANPTKTIVDEDQQIIKNQSVELLIGQETLVRTRRKPERTNADFPEFNLLCCDTKVFDRDQEVLDGEFDPGSGRTLAACLTHASRTESMV